MGKFDGILICSDFDGTFFSGKIPENNIKAVNEFMAQGGHFTFCTGRRGEIFKEICKDFTPNVPLIGFSGGQIYDIKKDKSLKQVFFGPEYIELLRDVYKFYPGVKTIRVDFEKETLYFNPDDTVTYKDYWSGKATTVLDRKPLSKMVFEEEAPVYKAVAYFNTIPSVPVPELIKKICEGRASVTANSWGYVEILPFGYTKGSTALELKKMLGDKTLIGIGDFCGDIPLLQSADIAFAVENALPEVKAVADHITVNVKEGALDALIKSLA